MFVWTCRGRGGGLGTIFSVPRGRGHAKLYHEFHSLSLSVLDVEREGGPGFTPEGPGTEMAVIPAAPAAGGNGEHAIHSDARRLQPRVCRVKDTLTVDR